MTTTSIGALALSALSFAACNKSFSWSPGSTTPSSSSSSSAPTSSSPSSSSSGGAPTAVASGPETWKRYAVRGIELGMARTALVAKGFTCGKRANSRCYKIMDKRCDQGRCELREDAFGQWFELNGAKTELDYMSCATTETDAALIYEIRLVFGPRQLLSPDSTLGKALIAKYGTWAIFSAASSEASSSAETSAKTRSGPRRKVTTRSCDGRSIMLVPE